MHLNLLPLSLHLSVNFLLFRNLQKLLLNPQLLILLFVLNLLSQLFLLLLHVLQSLHDLLLGLLFSFCFEFRVDFIDVVFLKKVRHGLSFLHEGFLREGVLGFWGVGVLGFGEGGHSHWGFGVLGFSFIF